MKRNHYHIQLTKAEHEEIKELLSHGTTNTRTLTRCRILQLAHKGANNKAIVRSLQVGRGTVVNVKKRYLASGLKATLNDCPRPGKKPKLNGKNCARITALACSNPPEGRSRWTLRLLADKVVELGIVNEISHVTIGSVLKKK